MIDTLKIYSRLKNKGIQEDAANEIAEIFNEIVSEELATKTDIERLRTGSKTDIERLRTGSETNIEKLRIELKTDIERLRTELKTDIEKLRLEIAQTKIEILKWVAGMLVGQAALITALIKLL